MGIAPEIIYEIVDIDQLIIVLENRINYDPQYFRYYKTFFLY